LAGSPENAAEFNRIALETKRLLIERGFPADKIEVLSDNVSRAAILDRLGRLKGSAADDEFWLVLVGNGGRTQGDMPAFQVRGPRLTAEDLQTALDSIPGRQFVFLAASDSGAFLPILKDSRRTVLSATTESGEEDWPRFPGAWLEAFAENPKASMVHIAARAAALVEQEYVTNSLAQVEHSRLADPVTGTILEPPFGVDLQADGGAPAPQPSSAPSGFSASDIKVEIRKPDAMWEQQPATPETKKIIADARAAANPDNSAAVVLEQRIGYSVEQDRTTESTSFVRVFIARDEAVSEWANQTFPQDPPLITTKLEVARVIHPDGSVTVFNPAKLISAQDPESGEQGAAHVFLPGTKQGCVVEIGYRVRELLDATLPYVSQTTPLLRESPTLKTSVEIKTPEKPVYRVMLRNLDTPPQKSMEDGRIVYRWELGPLPAMEDLPGDPPWKLWMPVVEISSLPSWDEFAKWYRRIAQGSDEVDSTVTGLAAQLAQGASSRMDKIRRAYEYVSALRYVAIEMGVQGFRPRTPAQVIANNYGDCKDKANLLVALLKSQGVDARFVLLNRGDETDVSFPSWQFNHAIAFVPRAPDEGQPDDLWLDATDSVTPFGFVAPGDYGRNALVFGKDSADFHAVATKDSDVSGIRDDWELDRDGHGGWSGIFHRVATGTAEDGLRRLFRELGPSQRDAKLYGLLAALFPSGDFSKASVTGSSALGSDIEMRATVGAPAGALPRVTTPELDFFIPPDRNRPVFLNDGQPLKLAQTLRLHYPAGAPSEMPEGFEAEAAGEKLDVQWTRDGSNTLVRTASLDIRKPLVAAADYQAFRQALRKWNAAQFTEPMQVAFQSSPDTRTSQNSHAK
jgi:hypothetical protein